MRRDGGGGGLEAVGRGVISCYELGWCVVRMCDVFCFGLIVWYNSGLGQIE